MIFQAWGGARERGWTGRGFYEEFVRFFEGQNERDERERGGEDGLWRIMSRRRKIRHG